MMGNRPTRSANKRRVTSNSVDNAKPLSTGQRHQPQQLESEPTTAGAGPDGGNQLQVNIYRSYSQLGNGLPARRSKPASPSPDFKVYRRSARAHNMTPASRSMSLPRSFGRTQRLGDQLGSGTTPRLRTDNALTIARSSSRASNISGGLSASYKGVCVQLADMSH